MFKKFSSGGAGGEPYWPLAKIEAALKGQYENFEPAPNSGRDGALLWFICDYNNLKFLVGALQSSPGSGKIIELGFFAIFKGFDLSQSQIDAVNGALNISFLTREADQNLYLMAGMTITGAYDDGVFKLRLDTWNRDLLMTVHQISEQQTSLASAFLIAEAGETASFAVNEAPPMPEGGPAPDILRGFLDAKYAEDKICYDCNGRGKRGLLARECDICEGSGFIKRRR